MKHVSKNKFLVFVSTLLFTILILGSFYKKGDEVEVVMNTSKGELILKLYNETQDGILSFTENDNKQYHEIIRFCRELDVEWTASCWDVDSQKFINSLNPDFQKIASPMNTNHKLIEEACENGKKIFMSTGMSTRKEISEALKIINTHGNKVELMHCNSSYPLDEKNANLARMIKLRKEFGTDVGYSGHETCLDRICIAAVVLGATSIERHITLDRAMYGSDQAASIGVHALKKLIDGIRLAESYLGSDDIESLQRGEEEAHKKLKYYQPA